jgi:2-dehydro-3-deoxygluconokinase
MTRQKALFIGEAMIEISGEAGALKLGFAGDVLNTAWHVRRLLPAKDWEVAFFTATGCDIHSKAMRNFIRQSGIELAGSPEFEAYNPGLYIIHQENGDLQFTYWRKNSAARRLADNGDALWKAMADANIVYFSGITLAILPLTKRLSFLRAVKRARLRGARVVFDPNIRRGLWNSQSQLRAALTNTSRLADMVLPSFDDEREHFKDASPIACAKRYSRWGVPEVVVKNGGSLMAVASEGRTQQIDLERVTEVVDPTGAGDAFNAGYLAARMLGETIGRSVDAGHRLALDVIGGHGALG